MFGIVTRGKTMNFPFEKRKLHFEDFLKEIWRYSNIKCCTYPLRGMDTITDGGEIGESTIFIEK